MDNDQLLGARLSGYVDAIVASYEEHPACRHIDRAYLPSREAVEELIERLLELVYPGFIGRQDITRHNVSYHIGELIPRIGNLLFEQALKCFAFAQEVQGDTSADDGPTRAADLTRTFLERLPPVRSLLAENVQAAFEGDPAASHTDEIILAYPGLLAVTVYRLAHELYGLGAPLMARLMSEWVHARTGVDIHPRARIGRRFFIDHGTGVVIGETTDIGKSVKLYQGVTLGALSFPRDERGRLIRGHKRHPTLEDNVTLYANAIILGGQTHIGHDSVIGGSVFLTQSVPPHSIVTFNPPELRIRNRTAEQTPKLILDYQI